jgi:hypothetical protein
LPDYANLPKIFNTRMKKPSVSLFLVFFAFCSTFGQIDTSSIVYSWKLDESFANRIQIPVDTSLQNIQIFNPAFQKFTGVQTLGNISQPAQSLVFNERPITDEYVLINSFFPFMKRPAQNSYFNTKKPFTKLSYIKGGNNLSKEEVFEAFHTQNLTKNLNFGLHYSTMSSLGQYKLQRIRNNSFRFFSSYLSKNYGYHFNVNYNKIVADENGGILNDRYITDTTFNFSKDIPTLFGGTESSTRHVPDVYTEVKNLNILAVQELSFRSRYPNDSSRLSKKTRIFYPKLVYILIYDRTNRLFSDKNPLVGLESGLYSNAFISKKSTSDSLLNWRFSNAARLQFQGKKNNHYFIDYAYEIMRYSMTTLNPDKDTSAVQYHFITEYFNLPGLSFKSTVYNTYLSTGFSKLFAGRFDVNLYGRYYLSGYYSGDFILSGDVKLIFGKISKPITFYAKGTTQLKSPDYLLTQYASNNFIWTNNFNKTAINHLSTNLSVSSKKFDIQGDYYLLSGLIYMNNNALPSQYDNALSVLSLSAVKQFDFWKITSIHKLVYQKSENENVLDLPELTYFNSTYFSHLFYFKGTGGHLLAMLGFDLSYNTKYYADAYMPALNSYYRQSEKQLGNYPFMNVFLNLKLKRFRFFVKMEHLNEGWFNKVFNNNYFSAIHYPRNGRDLKFGLSWTFYD